MRTIMRSIPVSLLFGLVACGHDQLDFSLPDAGDAAHAHADSRNDTTCDPWGLPEQRSTSANGAVEGASSAGAGPRGGHGSSSGPSGGSSGSIDDTDDGTPADRDQAGQGVGLEPIPDDLRFQSDPNGYPAEAGQEAPWCKRGEGFEEVCGNDVDEDCDGTVDELAAIGRSCGHSCGMAIYVCDAMTNALVCRGHQGCSTDTSEACGDGIVDAAEECDPAAPGETAGLTCTRTCERPRFVRCFDREGSHPERCSPASEVCSERIGACVAVIGPSQPRCPDIAVEGGGVGEFYPMLEVQNEKDGPWQCWLTCSEDAQCPSTLSECYMGFCAVPL